MQHDGWFGEEVAATYDEGTGAEYRPAVIAASVDLLERIADGGPALELAVGAGRLAIPLARRGVRVHGIDLSRAMVQRLRAKPDGKLVEVTVGLDLMARLAGLRLRDRSGGWRDEPFTAETTSHVSVWEKVGDTGP